MLIRQVDPDQFVDAYNVKEQTFYPWSDVVTTPFGSAWLVVEPGRTTKPHNHHEHETFFILRGSGTLSVDGESRDVAPGDVIFLPAFGDHRLHNPSPDEDLHFLTIWWEDPAVLTALARQTAPEAAARRERFVAVAAGAPGAGDGVAPPAGAAQAGARAPAGAAAPAQAARIFARHQRLRGALVRHLDDPAGEAAADATGAARPPGPGPDGGDAAGAALDRLIASLARAGALAVRSQPALHCERCAAWKAPAEISGACPACGWRTRSWAAGACARCGRDAEGGLVLRDPRCLGCGSRLGRRPLGQLWFDLAAHAPAVRALYDRAAMAPALRAVVDEALDRGPFAVALSHPAAAAAGGALPPGLAAAGLHVENQGLDGRILRAARLLATAPAGGDGEQAVVFLGPGLEEVFFHAVLLPALADAAGLPAWSPAALVLCEARAAAAAPSPVPAGARAWLLGLARKLARDHDGLTPPTQAWTAEQRRFMGTLLRTAEEAGAAYQPASFSPRAAAQAVAGLVRAAREFAGGEAAWSRLPSRREERNTGVALELLAAKLLAVLAYPQAPEWSERLWRCLGYRTPLAGGGAAGEEGTPAWEEVPSFVPTGQPVRGLAELAAPRPGQA